MLNVDKNLSAFTGIEGCKLKYLKFQCLDQTRTTEFYQSLGMTLDGTIKFTSNIYLLKFSYHYSHRSQTSGEFILFELIKEDDPPAPIELEPVLKDWDCPRDYLVIYVHFLPRVIKRLQAKGFHILLPPQTLTDIQYAIIMDPNGIEIRLIEMSDVLLNDVTDKKQWFAKLGYYVIHAHNGIVNQTYMESMFSKELKFNDLVKKPFGTTSTSSSISNSIPTYARELSPFQPNKLTTHGSKLHTRRKEGICLVDSEVIVTGLTRTSYYWVGHAPREKAFTLCFIDNSAARPWQVEGTMSIIKNHRLVSIGIELGVSIQQAVMQLTKESSTPPIFTTSTAIVTQALGYILPMKGLHGLDFDLCSQIDTTDPTQVSKTSMVPSHTTSTLRKPKSKEVHASKPISSSGSTASSPQSSTSYINFNQKLRTVFSESALVIVNNTFQEPSTTPSPPITSSTDPSFTHPRSEVRSVFSNRTTTDTHKRRNSY